MAAEPVNGGLAPRCLVPRGESADLLRPTRQAPQIGFRNCALIADEDLLSWAPDSRHGVLSHFIILLVTVIIMNSPERALSFLEFNLGAREGGKPVQFESLTLSNLYGFETGDGTLTCYLDVTEELQNRYGTLHGGCIGAWVTTLGGLGFLVAQHSLRLL